MTGFTEHRLSRVKRDGIPQAALNECRHLGIWLQVGGSPTPGGSQWKRTRRPALPGPSSPGSSPSRVLPAGRARAAVPRTSLFLRTERSRAPFPRTVRVRWGPALALLLGPPRGLWPGTHGLGRAGGKTSRACWSASEGPCCFREAAN